MQLTWIEVESEQKRNPTFETPIAIGRTFGLMPSNLEGNRVSRLVIDGSDILDYHALLLERDGRLEIQPRRSQVNINGEFCSQDFCLLREGDRVQIGFYEIEITAIESDVIEPSLSAPETIGCNRMVGVLFPRRCGRLNSEECPHCDGGEFDNDPYFMSGERSLYENYGNYSSAEWINEAEMEELGETEKIGFDFTEADAIAVEAEAGDFEQDLTES
ncbi:FHA domain-containing protein [Lyngbya sp. CCY1209]|uniref:FHA domain-containing protein n=1 Tax=Lyngbya sp. CCY1209 TaxID=2886103 RepID=UPI002D784CA5|nr:FHA domain-containing protein [Lyngbya sp. CCY1209]